MSLSIDLTKYLPSLSKNDSIVVAYSGGVDSTVLLDLVLHAGYKVIIAHVNHNKRFESFDEENYVRSFAKNHGLDYEILDYHHDKEEGNFQAEAHDSRYEFFYQTAKKYNAKMILTAHHSYDNLETIIMNIIKGSNLYGYGGINECLYYEDVMIARPLLNHYKESIYEYAKDHNLTYFEDSSNQKDDYLRNRIRHHVIPLLLKENPSLNVAVENYSKQLFVSFELIRRHTLDYLNNELTFLASTFVKLEDAIQKDVINYLFEQYEVLSSNNKINDVIELIHSSKPNLSYNLGNDAKFIKAYDDCYIIALKEKNKVCENLYLYDTIFIDNYGAFYFRKTHTQKATDFIALKRDEKYPLIIRNRRHGDKLIIGDGHKKLKDFLIDKKVPKEERDSLLVVTDRDDEIIWVIGYYKRKLEDENELTKLIFEVEKNEKRD